MMNWNDHKKWIQEHANLGAQLSNEQAEDIVYLLAKYPSLYALDEKDTGKTDLVLHKIDTGDSKSV
uniref:Uncharacterized protein n=1 Tax=Romanomermis culicivorax TaxID=13658 RepID=A0A915K5Z6_ROMCU